MLVAIALVLAIVGGSGGGTAAALDETAHLVDAGELTGLEAKLGHALYWAGERAPARIELRGERGNFYLRYLPPGVAAGDPEQRFLTVGTYPVEDAVAALERTAAKAGTAVGAGPGDAIVLRNPEAAGSVYLAYPGTDLEIEVYDPRPGRALRLIQGGQIVPVGG